MKNEGFLLQIMTREGVIFKGHVSSLTSYNARGKFDILPHHTNFICLIENELVINLADGTDKRFSLFAGLLQFFNNTANIFLGFKK